MGNLVGGQILAELVASQGSRQCRFAAKEREFADSAVSRRKLAGQKLAAKERTFAAKERKFAESAVRRRKLTERKLAAKERKFAAKERKFAECGFTRGLGCPWAETARAEIDGENKKFAAKERKLPERDFFSKHATGFRQWQTLNHPKIFP